MFSKPESEVLLCNILQSNRPVTGLLAIAIRKYYDFRPTPSSFSSLNLVLSLLTLKLRKATHSRNECVLTPTGATAVTWHDVHLSTWPRCPTMPPCSPRLLILGRAHKTHMFWSSDAFSEHLWREGPFCLLGFWHPALVEKLSVTED